MPRSQQECDIYALNPKSCNRPKKLCKMNDMHMYSNIKAIMLFTPKHL